MSRLKTNFAHLNAIADLRHICQRMNQFGHGKGTIYGGCSEYTIIPARYAYLLTTDLDDAKAAILERKETPLDIAHSHSFLCTQRVVLPIKPSRRYVQRGKTS